MPNQDSNISKKLQLFLSIFATSVTIGSGSGIGSGSYPSLTDGVIFSSNWGEITTGSFFTFSLLAACIRASFSSSVSSSFTDYEFFSLVMADWEGTTLTGSAISGTNTASGPILILGTVFIWRLTAIAAPAFSSIYPLFRA